MMRTDRRLTNLRAVVPFVIAGVSLAAVAAALVSRVVTLRFPQCDVWHHLDGAGFCLTDMLLDTRRSSARYDPGALLPSARQRSFHRTLRSRRKLSDDEFVEAFYSGSGVPHDVPVRLRRELANALGVDLAGIHPNDNITHADDELDFADIIYRIERAFGVTMHSNACSMDLDVTFDALVHSICAAGTHKDGAI